MAGVEVHIDGLAGLELALRDLVPRRARAAMREAGMEGGAIWQKEIEDHAPRLTGMLAESVQVKTKIIANDEAGGNLKVTVQIDPKANRYAEGAHEGLSPEFEVVRISKNGKVKMRRIVRGKSGRGLKSYQHWAHLEARFYEFGSKHQPARPFIGPAYEAKKEAVLTRFVNALRMIVSPYF